MSLAWQHDILEQMDETTAEYRFPMLNNFYLRGAGVRLTAFTSASEWLVTFEQLGVMEDRDFVNAVSAYGNRINKPGTQKAVRLIQDPEGRSFRDENGKLNLDRSAFTIVVRSKIHRFTPAPEDFVRAGVNVDATASDAVKILRFLSAEIPEELFLSDAELLEVCGRADASLTRFVRLSEWSHPDLAEDERPSDSPCLRALSRAIAANDASLYECAPDEFNTHWSLWERFYDM